MSSSLLHFLLCYSASQNPYPGQSNSPSTLPFGTWLKKNPQHCQLDSSNSLPLTSSKLLVLSGNHFMLKVHPLSLNDYFIFFLQTSSTSFFSLSVDNHPPASSMPAWKITPQWYSESQFLPLCSSNSLSCLYHQYFPSQSIIPSA